MKRFLFWFALTLVGLFFLLHTRRSAVTHQEFRLVRVETGSDGQVRKVYADRRGRIIEPVRAADEGEFDRDPALRREHAEGLPVPIVPGSRTTEARIELPSRSQSVTPERHPDRRPPQPQPRVFDTWTRNPPAAPSADLLTVTGRLSATEERAREDARRKLERLIADKLAPEVPRSWKVPSETIDGMIREVVVVPRQRDYGTVYEATLKVDFSPRRRAEVVAAYHRQEVVKRLAVLGSLLVFVLACLAVVSGYIHADEATKGYYTTRLRLAAAAGVGAAGVVLYKMLA